MKKKSLNDVIKKFEKEAEGALSENRPMWEGTPEDDLYNVDIHIWRKPGMASSLQTISGNKISIMTATASYLGTLLNKGVLTEKELNLIVNNVRNVYHGKEI